ncbi:MAG: hypothetical protein AMJ90_04085 [candidate division Zixibacteria bacterium SM23_73_2]|nr:MAG: hypothetical protein AMJ90_04085 [candidate division Zixibacteria bacterium SM23_73_2]
MKSKSIIILIISLLFLIIILQNTQVVTLQLFFWKIEMSRIILLILTLLIGAVIGYAVAEIGAGRHKNK